MARRRNTRTATLVYLSSFLLHAGVALALARVEPPPPEREPTRITIREVKKPAPPKPAEPPPPPPPPPEAPPAPAPPKAVKKAAPPPPAPAAPAPTAAAPAAVPSFGLTLAGGSGGGAGGIAVPQGDSLRGSQQAPEKKRVEAPKALLAKTKEEPDSCLEQLVKPKPITMPQPTYTDRAREAAIEGKVRVELTVDESGNVVDVKVLESLGYGLDEAALEAARNARFEAATRCGVATRTTFVIGIRFAL